MKENRDFKGVWIPKEIWLNTDLSIIEKVLLVEIDSLDNSDRGCFASNEYLANFVQLSEGRVANIISDLKKRKFIIQVFFDGRNRGLRISKSESSFNENVKAESTKTGKQTTRKREHNNTVNKTTNNTDYILSENSKEFSPIEINEIEIKEKKNGKKIPCAFQAFSSYNAMVQGWADVLNLPRYKNCKRYMLAKYNRGMSAKEIVDATCKCFYKSGYHTSNLWKVRSNLSTEYWTVKASFPSMEY